MGALLDTVDRNQISSIYMYFTYVKGLVTIRMIDRVLLVVSSYYLSLES